jgi:ankyrin repeat protein
MCNCKGHETIDTTPLHRAALHQRPKEIKKALKHNGELINALNSDGLTPLGLAIFKGGELNVIKALLDANADIFFRNCSGRTALHIAAYCNNPSVVKLLFQYEDKLDPEKLNLLVNMKTTEGETPLAVAIKYECFDVIQPLLERGANIAPLIDPSTSLPHTLLILLRKLASQEKYFELFTYLVTQLGPQANFEEGVTPLHIAAAIRNKALVSFFLKSNNALYKPPLDWKILFYSIIAGECKTQPEKTALLDTAHCLLETGMDINQFDTKRGLTILHAAIYYNFEQLVSLLLKYNANPNLLSISGHTALAQAVLQGRSLTIVEDLMHDTLNKKGLLSILSLHGESLLYLAAISDKQRLTQMMARETQMIMTQSGLDIKPQLGGQRLNIIKSLLIHGLNANTTNSDGKIALHAAVSFFNAKTIQTSCHIIEILIRYGANPFHRDKQGQTPLDYAHDQDIKGIILESLKNKNKVFRTQIKTISQKREKNGLSISEAIQYIENTKPTNKFSL